MSNDTLRQISRSTAQIIKQRAALNAGNTPLREITRPAGMTPTVFNRRLKILSKHEHKRERLVVAYLQKL